jgi:hypothetical protein
MTSLETAPIRRWRILVLAGALMLAIVVLTAIVFDAGWDTHGDVSARSLPGSDHASALALADLTLAGNEERSRGAVTLED